MVLGSWSHLPFLDGPRPSNSSSLHRPSLRFRPSLSPFESTVDSVSGKRFSAVRMPEINNGRLGKSSQCKETDRQIREIRRCCSRNADRRCAQGTSRGVGGVQYTEERRPRYILRTVSIRQTWLAGGG